MGSRLSRCLLATLTVTALISFSAPVAAQGADRETAQKVLMLVKNANDEFDRAEYDDALRLYQEAYDIYPNTVLLYRIGLSAEKTGETRRAIEAYSAYVEAAPEGDTTAEKLGDVIPKLRATLPPRITVNSTPEGADVHLGSLESDPVGTTPGTFELSKNTVELIVRLDGYRVERRVVELQNGEDDIVDVELSERKGLVSGEETSPVEPADTDSSSLAIVGWTTTGIGVALLGTGALFAGLSSSKTNEVNSYDKRAPGASRDELESLKDTATSQHKTSVATFIAGGVVTGVGVAILLVDMLSDDGEQAVRPTFGVGHDGAFVGVGGRF